MHPLEQSSVAALFLYADDNFLRSRMTDESGRKDADKAQAALLDKFVERSIRENREMLEAARVAGMRCVDVAKPGSIEALTEELLAG